MHHQSLSNHQLFYAATSSVNYRVETDSTKAHSTIQNLRADTLYSHATRVHVPLSLAALEDEGFCRTSRTPSWSSTSLSHSAAASPQSSPPTRSPHTRDSHIETGVWDCTGSDHSGTLTGAKPAGRDKGEWSERRGQRRPG